MGYPEYVEHVKGLFPADHAAAMQYAVGALFDEMGLVERELLRHYGLTPEAYLVDIGCGSGRLTKALNPFLGGRYLGTDVVEDLLAHARTFARPDWRIEFVNNVVIPETDGQADMVCFFSVLTHLLHEHSFVYLLEAKRVLKRGGRIVFSFLEYAVPSNWNVFQTAVDNICSGKPNLVLNAFLDRDTIKRWAAHLGMVVEDIRAGNERFLDVREPIALPSGGTISGFQEFGQSVCVLSRP